MMVLKNLRKPFGSSKGYLRGAAEACLVLAFFAVFVAGALAQETTAGLQGYVKDQSGAVIPNSAVKLSGPALIVPKTTETDHAGYYRFADLPPGIYKLTVTASGFPPTIRQ